MKTAKPVLNWPKPCSTSVCDSVLELTMSSLLDQLKNAGLVDDKKAKQVKKDQRKQQKQARGRGEVIVDETRQAVEAAKLEKTERDRELNRQRQAEADRKAIAAQI